MKVKYKDMTNEQKKHLVDVFYQRELVPAEKTGYYTYCFNDKGVCEYAE